MVLPFTGPAGALSFRSARGHWMIRTMSRNAPRPVEVVLRHTRPYAWQPLIRFLEVRAIPGVEAVADGCYQRTIGLDGAAGSIAVRPERPGRLRAIIRFPKPSALPEIVARLRRLFDLDADAETIGAHLARDPSLAPLVRRRPGLRVPGAWDDFELVTRAILGQQVSVAAARTFAARLAAAFGATAPGGRAQHLFPTPDRLVGADLTFIGLTRARAAALSRLAQALTDDPQLLSPVATLELAVEKLERLPGVGPWTAQYIAMRALREPDAFPSSDLGLLRALEKGGRRPSPAELAARSLAWRPWRAYAAMHLWAEDAERLARKHPATK
jgi:AraC family transcriptional regulator, regulatory protein of adaptative response / DNA-3-methyladenine glycosylase II